MSTASNRRTKQQIIEKFPISCWILKTLARHSDDALVHYLQGQNAELVVELEETRDELELTRAKPDRVLS